MTERMNPTDMMRQAHMTAEEYFDAAIKSIDGAFGNGYAKDHPELIVGFMAASAQDFHTAMFVKNAEALTSAIREVADGLAGDDN
jgi:hypothetical protein